MRHAQPSMSGRTVSSVQGQADRAPTHTRGALPEDCGPSGPVRRAGTCRQGGVRGAEGRPRRGPAAVRRLHPMEAAGLLTPKPQACRGRRPLLPGFTRPGDSAMARAAARDLAAGRGSSGQRPAGGRAHSSVCACAGLRGHKVCASSVSQGALHVGACSLYSDIKPAFVKIIGHTYPF